MLAMSGVGWFGLGLVGFILLVALAFWPARVARRKGHSWLLFFIFSLFFFPAAVILAYVVRDRRREVVVYAR
jgi:ABC-type Mn2+/Zn2+ transport system permease subunit